MEIKHDSEAHTYHIIPEKYATFNQRTFIEAVITHSNEMGMRGERVTGISNPRGTHMTYLLEYEKEERGDEKSCRRSRTGSTAE